MLKEESGQKKLKEFGLSSLAINNKKTVMVITILLLFAGLSSYISMPRESFPEIIIPEIYIGTPYPGNSALDIEKLITKPLEKEINKISSIDKLTSTSVQGYSTIRVSFKFDVTPSEALRKVKDKVDIAKSSPDFPNDLPADPNVFEMNISEFTPISNINLSGPYSKDKLKDYAEDLEEALEDLPEISDVKIRGINEKEVRIIIDLPKLESMSLSFNDVAKSIKNENHTISGGDILINGILKNVRVIGEFSSVEDLNNIIVKNKGETPIYLKNIADISFVEKQKNSYAREKTKPVVMLDIIKKGGENLLSASDKINEIIKQAKDEYLPKDLEITITNDQSNKTRNMVSDLENSIIMGVIFVVLILLFFLGTRNALIVGIAIPLSMLISFIVLSIMGVTLNFMVLFSLILALGMLVDNGIVIVENVYRYYSNGHSPNYSSKKGVGEVALAIISSTSTTLAAFLPLAMWPGMMGEFMKYLPITLMITLGASLFVGLVINPVFTSKFLKIEDNNSDTSKKWMMISHISLVLGVILSIIGKISTNSLIIFLGVSGLTIWLIIYLNKYAFKPGAKAFQGKYLPILESYYHKFVQVTLREDKYKKVILSSFGLLVLSVVLLLVVPPKILFFPENEPALGLIYIELPPSTDIEETNKVTKQIELEVIDYLKKYEVEKEITVDKEKKIIKENFLVNSIIAQAGNGSTNSEGSFGGNTPNNGKVTLNFVEMKYRRGVSTSNVLLELRELLKGKPGVNITVEKDQTGPPAGKPINLEISGSDYYKMITEAQKVKQFIQKQNIAGIEELQLDVKQGIPQLLVSIDRAKSGYYGISTGQIGNTLRTAIFGQEVSRFKPENDDDDYEINIRLDDNYRYDENFLLNQRVTFRDETGKLKSIPIASVVHTEDNTTFDAVKRKNMKRTLTLFSNVIEGYNPTEVVNKIKKSLTKYNFPKGLKYSFTGEQEEQTKQMAFLSKALLIAVFLVYLIMVSQFNSGSVPLVVLASVIMSMMGVFFGLILFRMEFVVIMTMIGIISLAGVVVNNAIVLIDYTNLLVNRKIEKISETEDLPEEYMLSPLEVKEAIIEAGRTRLRPVLLTAITTILGLIPLAIGLNINFITLFTELDANFFVGGENSLFWGPMSWTIIFGLSFATFLTLLVVPAMFYLLYKIKYKVYSKRVNL